MYGNKSEDFSCPRPLAKFQHRIPPHSPFTPLRGDGGQGEESAVRNYGTQKRMGYRGSKSGVYL